MEVIEIKDWDSLKTIAKKADAVILDKESVSTATHKLSLIKFGAPIIRVEFDILAASPEEELAEFFGTPEEEKEAKFKLDYDKMLEFYRQKGIKAVGYGIVK